MGGTLVTVAKDVKIQVEFNPALVRAYRLIGYENRLLRDEDFNDDTKDAGDIGSGHSVTALYEVIPVGVESDVEVREPEPLRYQEPGRAAQVAGDELLTLQVRYKSPEDDHSQLLALPVVDSGDPAESLDFQFQAAVAEFGLLLRRSPYKGAADFGHVVETARASLGQDRDGYRAEFVRLVERARGIDLAHGADAS